MACFAWEKYAVSDLQKPRKLRSPLTAYAGSSRVRIKEFSLATLTEMNRSHPSITFRPIRKL